MSALDDLTAVILEQRAREVFGRDWREKNNTAMLAYLEPGSDWHDEALRTAQALLDSPALVALTRAKQAEALRAAALRGLQTRHIPLAGSEWLRVRADQVEAGEPQ